MYWPCGANIFTIWPRSFTDCRGWCHTCIQQCTKVLSRTLRSHNSDFNIIKDQNHVCDAKHSIYHCTKSGEPSIVYRWLHGGRNRYGFDLIRTSELCGSGIGREVELYQHIDHMGHYIIYIHIFIYMYIYVYLYIHIYTYSVKHL